MKIAVGSDHAGYDEPKPYYKPEIDSFLQSLGHEVIDCGTDSPAAVDYPDIAKAVCAAVIEGKADVGILLCGTGIGMSITANRHREIRAAVCTSPEMARLSREHNHANILCIGRRILSLDACKDIIEPWLSTPHGTEERHERRVSKMS